MYSSGKQEMPPLWIWSVVGLVVVLSAGLVYKVALLKTEKEFAFKTAYVRQQFAAAGNHPVILMLGTSLTECGVDSTNKIETNIEQRTGIRPIVIKLWRRATTTATFLASMPVLKKLQPAVLVVEANMLVSGYDGQPWVYRLQSAVVDATHFRILGKPYFPNSVGYYKSEGFELNRFNNGVMDTSEIRSFKEFLVAVQARGTRVLLVNFPYQTSVKLNEWNNMHAAEINRNIRYIQNSVPVHYYNPKWCWDSTYFFDGAHMNQKGKQAFSPGLQTQLANELHHL